MGTAQVSTTAVSKSIMKQGPTLNHSQQMALCVEVTEMEINDGLCSISEDKAPELMATMLCSSKKPGE
ncbi:hypothetical protein KY289_030994 [Solanum tuberosum]|nr:hypothetical protein KY289_030994 [Solanum tuberosum]